MICLAIVKNACSTLVAFFADVSRKGIPSWSANSYNAPFNTAKSHGGRLTYLGDAVLHNLLASQVGLVADEQLVDALRSVSIDLLKPLLDVCEGV